MNDLAIRYDPAAYLTSSFEAKGIGGWRKLYLSFITDLAPESVIEFGAGAPDFLDRIEARERVAVDVGTAFANEFAQRNIRFAQRDLERDGLADLGPADVAICSDVFEHLVNPALALDRICEALRPEGILFSHVPNEYRLGHMWRVMTGKTPTVQYHKGHAEWDDPHFRRFSDIGFRSFLARRFAHNLCLTDLRYGRMARTLRRLGMRVPYCLQGGPTYASTNDAGIFERLGELKKAGAYG
jgi:SAM-dependent methyltransferase